MTNKRFPIPEWGKNPWIKVHLTGKLIRGEKECQINFGYMPKSFLVQHSGRSAAVVQAGGLQLRLELESRIRMAEKLKPLIKGNTITGNLCRRIISEAPIKGLEENIKIVEMDLGDYKPMTKARNSYSNLTQLDRTEHRISTHRTSIKQEYNQISPAPSAITDISPRTCSNHFEEYSSFGTAQSSPQCYSAMSKPDPARLPFSYPRSEYAESLYNEYPFYPNYMANTESSRAKVRSHSAPKQRPVETFERQPSRRRPSLEGRNVPRAVRMQRSSSHVGSTAQNYQYPWSVKLDRSAVSLKDSECGSTSTVLTNTNYCRSLVGFEASNVV
ncbi:UNVERIFIED_CONTAM: hypothetical protein Sradi_1650600 [Sesamum radiatum]|uniref:DUF4005 domain-containing protein n=1 Tax=Sesamum radiatum TaxID=300843 RepID=A0AAW2UB32_SESRA